MRASFGSNLQFCTFLVNVYEYNVTSFQMVRALSTGGGDARSVLLAKRKRKMVDARDRLGQMAKTTDARAKIDKIRNIKQGKVITISFVFISRFTNVALLQLDVKKTSKGRITITTTTRGNVVLTTRKKEAVAAAATVKRAFLSATAAATARPAAQSRQIGSLTRRVGRGGQISLSTRKAGSALRPTAAARQVPARRSAPAHPLARSYLDREETFRPRETFRSREETFPLTRTIRGTMSAAAKLDGRLP